MKKEKSCGIVVFKEGKILMEHSILGFWGLPKGHVEMGETEEETALREVLEETGIKAKIIPDFRKMITYQSKPDVMKDVVFFVGIEDGGSIIPQEAEVKEVKYIEYNEALKVITHDDDRSVIESACQFFSKLEEVTNE